MHARLSKILSNGYRDRAWVDFNSYFLGVIRYDENYDHAVQFLRRPGCRWTGLLRNSQTQTCRTARPAARQSDPRPEEIENFSQPHYELLHEWRLSPATHAAEHRCSSSSETASSTTTGPGRRIPTIASRRRTGLPFRVIPTLCIFRAHSSARKCRTASGAGLPRLTWKHDRGELLVGGEFRIHRSLHWGRLSMDRADSRRGSRTTIGTTNTAGRRTLSPSTRTRS